MYVSSFRNGSPVSRMGDVAWQPCADNYCSSQVHWPVRNNLSLLVFYSTPEGVCRHNHESKSYPKSTLDNSIQTTWTYLCQGSTRLCFSGRHMTLLRLIIQLEYITSQWAIRQSTREACKRGSGKKFRPVSSETLETRWSCSQFSLLLSSCA